MVYNRIPGVDSAGNFPPEVRNALLNSPEIGDAFEENTLRVKALEAMNGVSPESPVDGQTANLIEQPDTLTSEALTKKFAAELTKKLAAEEVIGQPDYVSLFASRSSYSKMSVSRIDLDMLNIRCQSEDGEHTVMYTLTGPNRYQFIGLVRGTVRGKIPRNITVEELTTQGNYIGKADGSTWFTTEVGATWSVQITTVDASDVSMGTYRDTRGGVWRVSVDGRPELSTTFTTWRSTAGSQRVDLFTIPTPGTYTIRGEFLGEDPDNPPTGSGSARGWLTPADWDSVVTASNANEGSVLTDVSPVSNKDFAFRMRPAGTEANYEFVPYHGTQSEVFASPTKYYVAGTELDVDDLPFGAQVPVENFEVVQHIYGRNSSAPDPTQNIVEIWTSQKILPDGTYHVSGRWRPLVDVEMNNAAYPMMLPGYLEIFDEVISSVGTAHAVSGDDTPRNIRLNDERDLADGYAMISSNTDFVAAVQIDSRRETLRVGAEDKSTNPAWIELRSGGRMAKIYQSIYSLGAVVPAGQMNRFSGRFWYGTAPGMQSVLSLKYT